MNNGDERHCVNCFWNYPEEAAFANYGDYNKAGCCLGQYHGENFVYDEHAYDEVFIENNVLYVDRETLRDDDEKQAYDNAIK